MNRKYFRLVSGGLMSLLLALAPLPALGQNSLEIPSGTSIRVRMIDNLSSEQSQVGDTFRGTLDEPIRGQWQGTLSQGRRRHRPSHGCASHRPAQ